MKLTPAVRKGLMMGLSPSDMKKNPALIPLFICLGMGVAAAAGYTLRLALKNPDVSWNNHKNPEPWQEYSNKTYKLYNTTGKEATSEAPKF